MKNSDIHFRDIQHYLYCPHRWGLITTDCSFAENAFVYKGKVVHEHVDTHRGVASRGVLHENSVHVYHDTWGISGVIDCLELRKDANGVEIPHRQGRYQVTIVEYKVTAPKQGGYRPEDAMQLLAQKICVDALFATDCATCFYYADTKKRVPVAFVAQDYQQLQEVLCQMRTLLHTGCIPPIPDKQHCSGCSLKDICLPLKKVKP